jgi:hypothetical protein
MREILLLLVGAVVLILYLFKEKHQQPPSHILVIRHANKPPTAKGALDSAPLDVVGKQRAQYYVDALTNYATQNYGDQFSNVYAIAPSPKYSMRPEQTVMPFCFTHSIPLHLPATIYDSDLFCKFRDAIYTNPQNSNRPVLICFEHTCIQKLIQSLGFPDYEHYWENSNFTCGIDIDVKAGTYKIVYFPFQATDEEEYNKYIVSKPKDQTCK